MTDDQKAALEDIEGLIKKHFVSGTIIVTTNDLTITRWTNKFNAIAQIHIAQREIDKQL